jgi:hypothetical protein
VIRVSGATRDTIVNAMTSVSIPPGTANDWIAPSDLKSKLADSQPLPFITYLSRYSVDQLMTQIAIRGELEAPKLFNLVRIIKGNPCL